MTEPYRHASMDVRYDSVIDKYVRLREIGTKERPRHRLSLNWDDSHQDDIIVGEETSLVMRERLLRGILRSMLAEAAGGQVR